MPTSPITAELSATHREAMTSLAGDFFQPLETLGQLTPVSPSDLPSEANELLNHSGHMTVSLEAWHRSPVEVSVEAETLNTDSYARHSLLRRSSDKRVVQSGVMRITLSDLPVDVRHDIENGGEPLGRILIRSGLLRQVELLALWRIAAGTMLAEELAIAPGDIVYGRSARILVEDHTAVELLEIVRP